MVDTFDVITSAATSAVSVITRSSDTYTDGVHAIAVLAICLCRRPSQILNKEQVEQATSAYKSTKLMQHALD